MTKNHQMSLYTSMALRPRSRRSAAVVLKEPQQIVPATIPVAVAPPSAADIAVDLVYSAAVPASFPPPKATGLQGGKEQVGNVPRHQRSTNNTSKKKKRRQNQIPGKMEKLRTVTEIYDKTSTGTGFRPMATSTRSSRNAFAQDQLQDVPAIASAPSAANNAIDLVSSSSPSPSDGSCVIGLRSNQSESDQGNHKDVKHLGKAISSPPKPAQKRRKSQKFVDTIDSRPYTPKFRVRGLSRGQNKLDSSTFDNILEIIWGGFSEEKRSSFACLDSIWFYLYSERKISKEKVLSWIKRKNIFSKHYVFVPIVIWSHWSLLILCHFGGRLESEAKTPCMLLLDSMQQIGPERLEPDIRKFVSDIHKTADLPVTEESIRKIPILVPKVPQQKDGEECGRYVLYFINLFLENAPESFNISEGYPYFMKEDWFSLEGLDNFWKRCWKLNIECRENEGKSKNEVGMEDEDIIEFTDGFV